MRMQKIQFRIGELAKQLNVEKFVIRFWEKEFNVSTNRSGGGQRFYSQEDLEYFKYIKTLLYEQGFTIAGAKKQLGTVFGSRKTTLPAQEQEIIHSPLTEQLIVLRQQLISLKKLL